MTIAPALCCGRRPAVALWRCRGVFGHHWPTIRRPRRARWIVKDFKFHTGENNCRNCAGTIRRWATRQAMPVLLTLHGTTGTRSQVLLTPAFARRAVHRRRTAAGCEQVLHRSARRRWPWKVVQAVGRHAGQEFRPIQLRRHRRRAASPGDRRSRHPPSSSGHGQLRWARKGRPGCGARTYPDAAWMLWKCLHGFATDRNGQPQLDDAAPDPSIRSATIQSGTTATTPRRPRSLKAANVFFGIATSGGTLAYQMLAGTHEKADKLLNDRLERHRSPPTPTTRCISGIHRADFQRPQPNLERIQAGVAGRSIPADDERNLPETAASCEARPSSG